MVLRQVRPQQKTQPGEAILSGLRLRCAALFGADQRQRLVIIVAAVVIQQADRWDIASLQRLQTGQDVDLAGA